MEVKLVVWLMGLHCAVLYASLAGPTSAHSITLASNAERNERGVRGEALPLVVSPRAGTQLGGTAVFVSGPRFDIEDQITCIFQRFIRSEATFVNTTHIVCVSPPLPITGRLSLQLRVNEVILEQQGVFILLPFSESFEVDFFNDALDLLVEVGSQVNINWPPRTVLPFLDSDLYSVDILLYGVDSATGSLVFLGQLASDIQNSGQVTISIPRSPFTNLPLLPVAFQVAFRRFLDISDAIEGMFPYSLVNSSARIGAWSDVGLQPQESLNLDFLELCNGWLATQPPGIGEQLLNRVQSIPCPPTRIQADLPSSGLIAEAEQPLHQNFYHPGTEICYRSIVLGKEGTGQQCCYDSDGNLVIGSPGGGSLDSLSPRLDPVGHFFEDTAPFIYCCKGRFPKCGSYFENRPSGDSSSFNPALPACAYGDPHLMTLDGHKYTFNGRGEFWLVQTLNDQLTVQGRMIEAANSRGDAAPATVFSALVAKQADSDTVQLEVRSGILIAVVGGVTVRFDDLPEQAFTNVILKRSGNGTLVAIFSSGTYLEARAENGFISTLFLSIRSDFLNNTRGLLGVFNGDPTDDLLPRNGSRPLFLNSSLQTIHESFGVTWIIDNEADSLFSYTEGSSWSTFHGPTFLPSYETAFSDAALEAEADSICGDDSFCRFDIAVTGRTEIGLSTFLGGREFEQIRMLSAPTVCDPPCENGVCLPNNTCNCAAGFSVEDRCTEPVFTECVQNPCVNGGTCSGQHGLDFFCECPRGFTGEFCRDVSLPAELSFINDSPRVKGNNISADIRSSRPVASMQCALTGLPRQDCSSGSITFVNVPPRENNRPYILRVVARTTDRLRTVIRRAVAIEQPNACTVHLINDGITVVTSNVTIEFAGTGTATVFSCRVDRVEGLKSFDRVINFPCISPHTISGLTPPAYHRVRIVPNNRSCGPNSRSKTFGFEI